MSEGSQTAGEALDAGEQARADIYRLLGALLAAPPDAALIDLLREIRLSSDTDDATMAAAWQGLQAAAKAADPDRLQDEYFNLFIGLGRGELVPYASFYLHGLLLEKVLVRAETIDAMVDRFESAVAHRHTMTLRRALRRPVVD